MKIRYTPQAIEDLKEIRSYIRDNLQNPQAATRISRQILDTCSILKDHPNADVSLNSKIERETDFRYIISGNYLAFYRVERNIVSVIRILDGRQDYLRVLFPNPKLDS